MSLASLVPIPRIDPNEIPPLLPWGLRYNSLYPYSNLFSHIVETHDDDPSWTSELEAYYKTFHLYVWYYLGIDDGQDSDALKAAQERAEALRKSHVSREGDDGASLADLEWAIELLTTRCRVRWDRLYGLDAVRQKYFDNQRQLHPAADYLELKQMLPCDAEFKPPKAARQSLWPIPIEFPRDPELIHEDQMICLGDGGVDWSEYALPDQPTGESEAARRRIERGEPAMEEVVAESDADAPTIEDVTTPLLVPSVGEARSSGFFSTLGGLLRHRYVQPSPYAAATSLCIVGRQPAQQHIVDRLDGLCPPFSLSVTFCDAVLTSPDPSSPRPPRTTKTMSSGLEKSLFQLKFTTKQLQKQSRKASKDETTEKAKLKKALQQGNTEGARIYASNAIRKKNESLNLLRLSSRIDAVASRVETAVTMRQVTGSMAAVVKNMDRAMQDMNLERISAVMDKFESQFEDMDVQTGYLEGTLSSDTAIAAPSDQIDLLMSQVADEAGLEVAHELQGKSTDKVPVLEEQKQAVTEEQEDALAQRLRALRPAMS
ncbi:hypothetical protein JCM10296v2_001233 [Rhodotorula toruloides]